jgi:predicted nucleic acid-binding protein
LLRSKRLSAKAAAIFNAADVGQEVIYIPTIVLGELMHIAGAAQIALKFSNVLKQIKSGDNYVTLPLDLPIIEAAAEISARLEMHDRLIVATAKVLNVSLITRDEAITAAGIVPVVW